MLGIAKRIAAGNESGTFMKILMPIAQFQLGHGGAEIQAHRLARALIANGHGVEIVTSRHAGEHPRTSVDGVPVRRLFSFNNQRFFWRLGSYSYTALLTSALLRERSHHDVVHVHQAFHPAFAAALARRLGGRPVVVKIATAGAFGDLTQMREGRPTLPAGSNMMVRSLLRWADRLVAISDAVAHELVEAGVPASRIARIPNGIDLRPLPTADERALARSSLGIRHGTQVVVYVGRSGEQKGSDILLEAWRRLLSGCSNSSAPEPRLFVLGQGFETEIEFARMARELGATVTVPGRVADVPRYLNAADLFVLPSRGEGLSNAILEAMMLGVPCVVSDIPPNREIVHHARTGLTVRASDSAALASAIEHALAHPAQMAALAAAARRLVEERYAMPRVVAAYEDLYRQLIDR